MAAGEPGDYSPGQPPGLNIQSGTSQPPSRAACRRWAMVQPSGSEINPCLVSRPRTRCPSGSCIDARSCHHFRAPSISLRSAIDATVRWQDRRRWRSHHRRRRRNDRDNRGCAGDSRGCGASLRLGGTESRDNDDHKNAEVRSILSPLKSWAAKHHLAVIFNTHFTKPGEKEESRKVAAAIVEWLADQGWPPPKPLAFLPFLLSCPTSS